MAGTTFRKTNAQYLADAPLFANVSPEKLQLLGSLFFRKSYKPGEIIAEQGEVGRVFYVIARGMVFLERHTAGGAPTPIAVLVPGDITGELAMIDQMPRPARATARTVVHVLALSAADFQYHILGDHDLCLALLKSMALNIRMRTKDVVGLRSQRVESRIIEFFQTHADESGHVVLKFPQTQLAELLGCSRGALSRCMRHLEEMGQLKNMGHRRYLLKTSK